MCGRYLFLNGKHTKLDELAELAESKMDPDAFSEISLGEVFPGTKSFAGIYDPKKNKHLTTVMKWGLELKGRLIINARSETCFSSPFFKDCHPCVLPATAYYEWSKTKQRYAFAVSDDVFYLCGLCRREKDGELHYVIVTEDAKDEAAAIHPRQPVIFGYENAKAWCSSKAATLVENNSVESRYFEKA